MGILPYLFFEGRTDEAVAFYQEALGAEVEVLMRYGDAPEGTPVPPGSADNVMHMALKIGDTTILASDGMCTGEPSFQGFALNYNAKDVAHSEKVFAALSEGGVVRMPLGETFFSPSFGMVADRFGVLWMVFVHP